MPELPAVWLLSSGSSGRFVLALVVILEITFFVLLVVKGAALRRQLIESCRAGYSLTTFVLVAANRSFGTLRAGPVLRLALTELALIYQAALAWMIPRRRQARLMAVQVDDPDELRAAINTEYSPAASKPEH